MINDDIIPYLCTAFIRNSRVFQKPRYIRKYVTLMITKVRERNIFKLNGICSCADNFAFDFKTNGIPRDFQKNKDAFEKI